MNNSERILLNYICDGDLRMAQKQARLVLNGMNAKKDEHFKADMLRKLDAKGNRIELPYNVKGLLVAEDMTNFPRERYILRPEEEKAVERVMAVYRASGKLADLGISYYPALMLYGQSGCGKTMLARYIAHRANLPFVYVKFSNLVNSHLGETQSNVGKVFDYVRTEPCVLCFDEIDAIGMKRGQQDDVGEMNRVVIALMQELDQLPNKVIIVGTTNRFDKLDPALIRRFPIQYELKPLTSAEAGNLAIMFFAFAGVEMTMADQLQLSKIFAKSVPSSTVIKECTEIIVQRIIGQEEQNNGKKP